MKLYTFHKVARPLTDYLNSRHIPFKFVSINNSCHVLKMPLYIPTCFGNLPPSRFTMVSLVPKSLSLVVEGDSILIF